MALKTTPISIPSSSNPSPILHLSVVQSPYILFTGYAFLRSTCPAIALRKSGHSLFPAAKRSSSSARFECFVKSTEESAAETLKNDDDDEDPGGKDRRSSDGDEKSKEGGSQRNATSLSDALNLGIREPVYEVVEVTSNGMVSTRKINRRDLLKSSGLRPRDIRSVDPSLWLTNTMPSLLVRQNAVLLNLGSLRAIVMQESVFIFNYNRRAGKAFIDALLPRLNPNMNGGPSMPFELEVVEAALHSRIQRFENRLMDLEPRVQALLEVLPNRLTAGILEQLRISKQTLVELGSKAGALKQMLLDILEDSQEIRRLCIVGRNCILNKNNDVECILALDKQIAEEEEEEIEMLLENYLQRCESCHNQAERLLDSAKEMEDSISVNLRYIWHELEILPRGTCVCVLAYNRRDCFWCCCGIFPHVLVPQGEENSIEHMHPNCVDNEYPNFLYNYHGTLQKRN